MTQLEFIEQIIKEKEAVILDANDKIWSYAELPYEETRSSALLCSILESEGFTVETGVAEIPTAFVARYVVGTGKPVMGILGEFDALATLSQKAGCTVKDPVQNGGSGHGCGHCCLGTGALAAALAVKEYLVQNQKDGTIIYYGCAAEEGQERNSLWPEPDYLTAWILYTHGIRRTAMRYSQPAALPLWVQILNFSEDRLMRELVRI